jgi:hypothetical protein
MGTSKACTLLNEVRQLRRSFGLHNDKVHFILTAVSSPGWNGVSGNIDNPEFENSVAAQATGVDPTLLQAWANRGLIQVTQSIPGQGRRRLYSIRVLISVALLARLTEFGVSASLASLIAGSVTLDPDLLLTPDSCPLLMCAGRGPEGTTFRGTPIYRLEELPGVLERRKVESEVCVVVPVRDVVNSVLTRLKTALGKEIL